jgi:hypothetical protein
MCEYLGRTSELKFGETINVNDNLENAYHHIFAGLAIICGKKCVDYPPEPFPEPFMVDFSNFSCLNPAKIRSCKILFEIGTHFIRAFNVSVHLHESTQKMFPIRRESLLCVISRINQLLPNLVDFTKQAVSPGSTASKKCQILTRDSHIMCCVAIDNLNKLIDKILHNKTPAVFLESDMKHDIPPLNCLPEIDVEDSLMSYAPMLYHQKS